MPARMGFTLLELAVTIAILMVVVPAAYEGVVAMKARAYGEHLKARTLAGLSSAGSSLASAVRNSYGVDYAGTSAGSDGDDRLSLYVDKQERHKLAIWVERDAASDVARLVASYDGGPPSPLHSNLLYVRKFDVAASPDPRASPARADDQPWVSVAVDARSRSPLGRETDDAMLASYQKSSAASYARWTLRNFVPTSLKR